ncbi:MAG: helix-turn-helix domain-containing protein [Oscillospiraceae bacterium]|jgi:hypothetical protein
MVQKNRFSILLEHLMSITDLKNYTLAQALQYDVSYISKWINGRMIPSEKTGLKILRGISHCIITAADEDAKKQLLLEYQITRFTDLESAIYDNLEAEYNYVRELQKSTGSTVLQQKTSYYAELSMAKFIAKMHHPVLRRVHSLDVMAAMDLTSISREYRLQLTSIRDGQTETQQSYPEVHFNLLINTNWENWDYLNDTVLLIDILTNMNCTDFNIFGSNQAFGKILFVVKEDFSIAGMLAGQDHCISVSVSEEKENCLILYHYVKSLCNRETLLLRKTTLHHMLLEQEYANTLLAPNHRYILGHMTEHFIPDDLFEEIVAQLSASHNNTFVSIEELRKVHNLTINVIKQYPIKIMFYETALSELAYTGLLDFYNQKVYLTLPQRFRYIKYFQELCRECENLKVGLVNDRWMADSQNIKKQCIFLSEGISYLRLSNEEENNHNTILVLNHVDMHDMFDRFYDEMWTGDENIIESNPEQIHTYFDHILQAVQILSKLEDQ